MCISLAVLEKTSESRIHAAEHAAARRSAAVASKTGAGARNSGAPAGFVAWLQEVVGAGVGTTIGSLATTSATGVSVNAPATQTYFSLGLALAAPEGPPELARLLAGVALVVPKGQGRPSGLVLTLSPMAAKATMFEAPTGLAGLWG